MTQTQSHTNTGSELIKALERAYTDIRRRNPDLPPVHFITGSGMTGRQRAKWGHYGPDRWRKKVEEGLVPEVFIAGERMEMGHEAVFATMLHESAHAVAAVRGVEDTSQEGKYHNRRFKGLAEELGLTAEKTGSIGYSDTQLTDETRETYAKTLERLEADLALSMPVRLKPKAKSKDRNNVKCECDCGRIIRVSRAVLDQGEIWCALCEMNFEEV